MTNKLDIISEHNKILTDFKRVFKKNKKPIEVKFRDLLKGFKHTERFTHSIHSYPAKLLVHIPYFFLNNTIFSKEGDNVLDPFNGSGTVYLETILSQRNAFGADSNPLARLISKVKSTKYSTYILKESLDEILNDIDNSINYFVPEVVNCTKWFPSKNIDALSKILFKINKIDDEDIKDFMLVSFSNCIKKVSYADPRVSVPVKLNPNRYSENSVAKLKTQEQIKNVESSNVYEKFKIICEDNIRRFQKLEKENINVNYSRDIYNDARKLCSENNNLLDDNSIQLIITSPPYAGAQKYIRSSSLNLGWTGLANISEIRRLDTQNIGREIYSKAETNIVPTGIKEADELILKITSINKSRANIACQYILEMKKAISEMVRVLKKNGYIVLVIGNNRICDLEFNTQQYLTTYFKELGLKLEFKLIDAITSYGLMTKRNKTADIISREYILVFKKIN